MIGCVALLVINAPGLVAILTTNEQQQVGMIGSGVIVSAKHVLTAEHVVTEAKDAIGIGCPGETAWRDVRLVHKDAILDLALLELQEPCGTDVTPLARVLPKKGDKLTLATLTADPGATVFKVITAVSIFEIEGAFRVATTVRPIAALGVSGSGVLNAKGELVGIYAANLCDTPPCEGVISPLPRLWSGAKVAKPVDAALKQWLLRAEPLLTR